MVAASAGPASAGPPAKERSIVSRWRRPTSSIVANSVSRSSRWTASSVVRSRDSWLWATGTCLVGVPVNRERRHGTKPPGGPEDGRGSASSTTTGEGGEVGGLAEVVDLVVGGILGLDGPGDAVERPYVVLVGPQLGELGETGQFGGGAQRISPTTTGLTSSCFMASRPCSPPRGTRDQDRRVPAVTERGRSLTLCVGLRALRGAGVLQVGHDRPEGRQNGGDQNGEIRTGDRNGDVRWGGRARARGGCDPEAR